VPLRYAPKVTPRDQSGLRYVALGDSYTIGTAVEPAASWPAQLVAALGGRIGQRGSLELVANLARDGRTSADLVRDQLPGLARWQPDFASVLIGVNDVVQRVPPARYEANARTVLATLLGRLRPDRVVTVGIPDYTVMPRGADYGDPRQRAREIEAFNAIMAAASAEAGIRHVDVVDLSRLAATDRSLVAADGLHPSGAQYALWVNRVAPVVAALLAVDPPPP
jgi:lysophospholipase L1-like esterase